MCRARAQWPQKPAGPNQRRPWRGHRAHRLQLLDRQEWCDQPTQSLHQHVSAHSRPPQRLREVYCSSGSAGFSGFSFSGCSGSSGFSLSGSFLSGGSPGCKEIACGSGVSGSHGAKSDKPTPCDRALDHCLCAGATPGPLSHLLALLVSLLLVVGHLRVAGHRLRQLRLERLELGEDVRPPAGRGLHPLLPRVATGDRDTTA